MDLLIKVLQAPYSYVVVVQILIVAALLLSLVWLLVQRTREAHGQPGADVAAPREGVAEVATAELTSLRNQLAQMERENGELRAAQTDAQDLKDKVKYLESKLLEYEILQEEIGTLTALKLENEHLKQELTHFQTRREGPAATESAAAPEAKAPSAASPMPTMPPVPAPTASAPVAAASPEPSPKVIMTTPENIPLPFDAPQATPPAVPAPEQDNPAGLEGLLKQIDELTSNGPHNPKT